VFRAAAFATYPLTTFALKDFAGLGKVFLAIWTRAKKQIWVGANYFYFFESND
jgi:hypothetical protein